MGLGKHVNILIPIANGQEGRNADMGLIMTSFTPNVICRRGNAPPYRKCQHLQNSIAAKDAPKSFGLDIKLPKHLYECQSLLIIFGVAKANGRRNTADRQCEATIRSLGAPDISSFYEVWEAIVAVTGMCIRFGQIGTAWYRGTLLRGELSPAFHPVLSI